MFGPEDPRKTLSDPHRQRAVPDIVSGEDDCIERSEEQLDSVQIEVDREIGSQQCGPTEVQ
jgi:hypothetical protein